MMLPAFASAASIPYIPWTAIESKRRLRTTARWAASAASRLRTAGTSATAELTTGLLRLHADAVRMVEREAALRGRFAAAHPDVATAVVPALASDVHDLRGLRRVGGLLAGE